MDEGVIPKGGMRVMHRFTMAALVASALLVGAQGCSDDGGTEATATTKASAVATSSTSTPSTSATEGSGGGGESDQALCDLLRDDTVARAFSYSGFPGGPVQVEAAKSEDDALAATLDGCAAQLSQTSDDGGASSATIVLGRVASTGDTATPVDVGPALPLTWVAIDGEPGLYRAMQFGSLPIGGAIVVGDHAYVLLRTAVEVTAGAPISPNATSSGDGQNPSEAFEAESERTIVAALHHIAEARN